LEGRKRAIVFVSLLVIVIVAVAVAQTSTGGHLLRSAGITAPAEPYTALAFTEPQQLGTLVEYGQFGNKRQSVGFTITNEQHHAMKYAWRISSGKRIRFGGVVSLRAGQTAAIHRDVLVVCVRKPVSRSRRHKRSKRTARRILIAKRVRVDVTLIRPSRSIDFLVGCHA